MIAASVIAGALIIFAFAHAPFKRAWGQIAAGVAVGLLVAGGWFATGYLGADDFNPAPVTSLTFIAPIADTVQYAMLSTGLTLNFGITMVAGVFAGSLVTALVTRRFHWEGFTSPRHMLRSIGGAALMGAGGAMAYGCSIGQGLTGLSTLALASFVAVGGILLGHGRGPARRAARAAAGAGAGRPGFRAGRSGPLTRGRQPHHVEIAGPHFHPLDQALLDQKPMRFRQPVARQIHEQMMLGVIVHPIGRDQ